MMPAHPTDLLEAYALHLLSPASEAEIDAHLGTCHACQAEVASLTTTLSLLAYAAPSQTPSAQVEERLFARIAVLRDQDQPQIVAQDEPVTWSAPAAPARGDKVTPLRRATPPAARRSVRWPAALSAVAAVILVIVVLMPHRSTPSLSLTAQAAQALHVSDPPTFTLKATKAGPQGAVAVMAMDPAQQRGVLVVAHLPPLSAGKIYEFWLVQSAGADKATTTTPAGTFSVSRDGSGKVFFTSSQPIDTVMNAGISLELAGGVLVPDSPMLLLIND